MKTYILEENYGDKYRITLEDDIEVQVNSYESSSESSMVKFTRPTIGYENTVLAAYSGVRRMYLEGTEIEKQDYRHNTIDQAVKAEASVPANAVWTRV